MESSASHSDPRVSIVIPAFNEEGNVEELCRQIDEMGKTAYFSFETIIVDDGSTDDTAKKLEALKSQYSFLRVETHIRNRGLTHALQTGFETARGDIFVFYPADLQYRPENIPDMVAKMDEGNDMVTGWKQGKYSKRFVSNIYNGLSRRIFGLQVHDLNSVKAFRREVIENMYLRKDWHRYLVALAVEQGYRVDEVKIPLYERFSGQSKFSGLMRIPIGILDMLAVKAQLSFLKKPLLYFGMPGFILIFLALLVAIVAFYLRYVENLGYRNLITLVIFLGVMGISLFILGFLAEALAAIKEEFSGLRHEMQLLDKRRRDRRDKSDGQDN